MLHYIGKNNSAKCMDMCLRVAYQEDPQGYTKVVNTKTNEEDTPLLLACQFKSNQTIKIILAYGGADIYMINSRKQSAYQLALSSGNEEILQILMKYQLKVKRRNSINVSLLQQPLKIENESRCLSFFSRICECLCWDRQNAQSDRDTETDRKMVKTETSPDEFIGQMEISWIDPEIALHSKLPLFGAISSPFSIKQSSMIVSNLLIVFQGLAQHPELLKNIIFKTETKYYVRFSETFTKSLFGSILNFHTFKKLINPFSFPQKINYGPWSPKALSQFYNGYFQPGKIPLDQLFYNITGNHCFYEEIRTPKSFEEKSQSIKIISNILSSNCIHALKSKPICPIKADEGRIQCFSILKVHGDHILINCPFISDKIKSIEEKQTREMKLLKSHYSNQSSMAVWIGFDEFFENFEQIIFCRAESSYSKQQTLKFTLCSQRIFIRFKTSQKLQKPFLSFCFLSPNDGRSLRPKCAVGWKIKNSQKEQLKKQVAILWALF